MVAAVAALGGSELMGWRTILTLAELAEVARLGWKD
jgi:hypothetical protein